MLRAEAMKKGNMAGSCVWVAMKKKLEKGGNEEKSNMVGKNLLQ